MLVNVGGDYVEAVTIADKTPVNISGTMTLGGTAQVLAAADPLRRHIRISTMDSVETIWINTIGTAAMNTTSFSIPIGFYYESPEGLDVTGEISIISATTGTAWYGEAY